MDDELLVTDYSGTAFNVQEQTGFMIHLIAWNDENNSGTF